jgi:hypothetical protein
MYDEVHYREGVGAAKKLQLQHCAIPADLALLIAAAMPDPSEQERASQSPPDTRTLRWPWTSASLRARLDEARNVLAQSPDAARTA